MKLVPLTGENGKGKFAMVDDEDYGRVSKLKWHSNNGYPAHSFKGGQVYLHNFVLGREQKRITIQGYTVQPDHRNRNKLDNRRRNLRTGSFNNANKGLIKTNTSGFKGVYWNRLNQKWIAIVQPKTGPVYLGSFDSLIDAAKAYDSTAKKIFGEFARLNFPMRFPREAL